MTKVAILPVQTEKGGIAYTAIAGDKCSRGNTAGEALDALTAQLTADESGTLIIVQGRQPDQFFSANQQRRLEELTARWRAARDGGQEFPPTEREELETLVKAELLASAARAAALADELGK